MVGLAENLSDRRSHLETGKGHQVTTPSTPLHVPDIIAYGRISIKTNHSGGEVDHHGEVTTDCHLSLACSCSVRWICKVDGVSIDPK